MGASIALVISLLGSLAICVDPSYLPEVFCRLIIFWYDCCAIALVKMMLLGRWPRIHWVNCSNSFAEVLTMSGIMCEKGLVDEINWDNWAELVSVDRGEHESTGS